MPPAQDVRDARALPGTGVTTDEDQSSQLTAQLPNRPSKGKGKATDESRASDKTMVAWARGDGGLTKEERVAYNNSILAKLWQSPAVTDSSPNAAGSSSSGSAQDSATVTTPSHAAIVDSSPVPVVPSAASDGAETISARCVIFSTIICEELIHGPDTAPTRNPPRLHHKAARAQWQILRVSLDFHL